MLDYRELYAVAHFGSSYEVMGRHEMRDCLAEARWWGFNAYSDWFDAADLRDPHNNPRREFLLPQALFEHKLASFRSADELGLACSLAMTPNHVYLDQLRPDLLADTSEPRYFGQLLCPSIPEARTIIIDNALALVRDLYHAGVNLSSLSAGPFDYGGCACARCHPWITTFGQVYAEIALQARKYYPDLQVRLVGWWWTAQEEALFSRWANEHYPGLFVSFARHIVYGAAAPEGEGNRPEGCEKQAFVHIGYADQAEPRDVYGTWGPVAASGRLERTVRALESQAYHGWTAYSEGQFDDVNKALLAGLSSGQFATANEVLQAYAERYFAAKGADRAGWAEWLTRWGTPFTADITRARAEFDLLARSATPGWRLEQWACKLRLFEAHRDVLAANTWDAGRLAAAETFTQVREELQRRVWGLGRIRHVLNERYFQPSWWTEHQQQLGARAEISLLPRAEA
ncbi:MAG: hypothetical protein ACYCZF_15965 [Anaerolineae bacterium]